MAILGSQKKKEKVKKNQIRSQILLIVHVNWSPICVAYNPCACETRHVVGYDASSWLTPTILKKYCLKAATTSDPSNHMSLSQTTARRASPLIPPTNQRPEIPADVAFLTLPSHPIRSTHGRAFYMSNHLILHAYLFSFS